MSTSKVPPEQKFFKRFIKGKCVICQIKHSVYLSLCILYTYYIISLRMLIHIVNNCTREKTS